MFWTRNNVYRIVLDFVKKVKGDWYGIDSFDGESPINLSTDLQMSSIQIVELSAYVNSFFHLIDVDQPPNLLADADLNNWVDKILNVRSEKDEFISFQSSGTSGQVKFVTHSIATINNEISFLSSLLTKPERFISFVPANHIYGFLFTVVLPAVWNVPVIAGEKIDKKLLNSNSLIIATPFNWSILHTSLNNMPVSCAGISSAAPLNDGLYQTLTEQGFQIIEIYGSTETGGVGYRKAPNTLFQLFPYLSVDKTENIIRSNSVDIKYTLLDHLIFKDEQYFRVNGRIDDAVQIGGVNIYLNNIQTIIESIDLVYRCELFAKSVASGVQLLCTIYLHENNTDAQNACLQQMHAQLAGVNFPTHIQFYSADNTYKSN